MSPELLVLRDPEETKVIVDRRDSLDFLDLRGNVDYLETQDQSDIEAITDRRANQESRALKELQGPREPEEHRVWTAGMDMDLQDLQVLREIQAFLDTRAQWVRMESRDLKDTRDKMGTGGEGGTQGSQENQVFLETQDVQDVWAPEDLLEAKT